MTSPRPLFPRLRPTDAWPAGPMSGHPADVVPTGAVLVVTGDPAVAEAVERLAAVVGIECDALPPERCSTGVWQRASLVVVGADALPELAQARASSAMRPGIVVVTVDGESAQTWEGALALGARDVISLPQGDGWLIKRMMAVADDAGAAGAVVAVVGASGGVGASMLAVALAREVARRGLRCALVDGDARGGGLDVVAGCEDALGPRWSDLAHARGRLAPTALSGALLRDEGVALLSHGRRLAEVPPEAMTSVVDAARRGHDLVVLDVPRHDLGDATSGLVDSRVLVVANRVRSVAAATALLPLVRADGRPVHVVVREVGRRASLDASDVECALGVDALTTIADDAAAAAAVENGDPWPRRGPVAAAASVLAAALTPRVAVAGTA